MAFNLDNFRNTLQGGGARPTLFEMRLNLPAAVSQGRVAAALSPFMVKVSEIPASTVGSIEVPYFGRKVKVAGDRTFANLTVTIINDENFAIRKALEEWMDRIAGHKSAESQFPGRNTDGGYVANQELVQYGRQGNPLRTYTFVGAFPVTLSAMAVDWNAEGTLQDFTCEFAYQWWEVNGQIPTRDNGGVRVGIDINVGA